MNVNTFDTSALHSLSVVGCLWSICLRAQPSGLYCLLWKLLLATPAGTAHPLAQVKSATGFQFCFCLIPVLWMPFLASEHRLPEFVYWRIMLKNKYSMFWLVFCLWILLCWQSKQKRPFSTFQNFKISLSRVKMIIHANEMPNIDHEWLYPWSIHKLLKSEISTNAGNIKNTITTTTITTYK